MGSHHQSQRVIKANGIDDAGRLQVSGGLMDQAGVKNPSGTDEGGGGREDARRCTVCHEASRPGMRQASVRRLRDRHHHSHQTAHPVYVEALSARLPLDVTVWYSNAPRNTRSDGSLITTD